jgi:hypothetical protein
MISVQTIIDRMRSALDAEGTTYYNFARDFQPAINYALEWTVGVITPYLGDKKFGEEVFRELTYSRVWQTSQYSRVQINPADFGGRDMWTILSIMVNPIVVVQSDADLFPNLPPDYYNEISQFFNQQVSNGPVVTQKYNAVGNTTLLPHESTFRPELSYLSSDKQCRRETIERYGINKGNPFSPGYQTGCIDTTDYCYLNYSSYESIYGGYKLNPPREIEISPAIPKSLVAIFYIGTPAPVTQESDIIPYPEVMMNVMISKALNYVSIKQNNGTNLRGVTDAELLEALGVMR